MDAPDVIHTAVAHHNAGRLAEAERIYRAILDQSPDDLNALNLLGVLARQTGRAAEAASLLGKAATQPAATADIHYNLGTALADLRRTGDGVRAQSYTVTWRRLPCRPVPQPWHHR